MPRLTRLELLRLQAFEVEGLRVALRTDAVMMSDGSEMKTPPNGIIGRVHDHVVRIVEEIAKEEKKC